MQKENGIQFGGGSELTRSLSRGFTLIEIIVATSLFTVVMLVTVGALLSLNDASRKAQSLRTVIDNLNFAVEDMNRKIRTGDSYHCYTESALSDLALGAALVGEDCSGDPAGVAISLRTQEKDPQSGSHIWAVYIFKKDPITDQGSIVQRISNPGGGTSLASEEVITSPEVNIRRMEFRVIGAEDPNKQAMVILNISGVVDLKKDKLRTDFSLQTAISKRGMDWTN
ncbi:MAG: type II secretion system protein [bacterium]|nr:type II secretion system protein [bacterium]